MDPNSVAAAQSPGREARLEQQPLPAELPLFCEGCGYSLHALPPRRCEHCEILHFRCPECGHHQPLMTIRPAVHRMMRVVRMGGLLAWIFFKLNFFVWLLVAWVGMGFEWSYQYNWMARSGGGLRAGPSRTPRPIDLEVILAFTLFGLGFGLVSRMLLLKWRRSLLVGLVLAGLVCFSTSLGAFLWRYESRDPLPSPFTADWFMLTALGGAFVIAGCVAVWPIWVGVVRLFLPTRAAELLLEAQAKPAVADPPRRRIEQ